jgi:hypothetical protein
MDRKFTFPPMLIRVLKVSAYICLGIVSLLLWSWTVGLLAMDDFAKMKCVVLAASISSSVWGGITYLIDKGDIRL